MAMYFFDQYITEAMTDCPADYVAVSHAGHGANSYAINYNLVEGPLAVFTQIGWGGIYDDPEKSARDVNELFSRNWMERTATGQSGLSSEPTPTGKGRKHLH